MKEKNVLGPSVRGRTRGERNEVIRKTMEITGGDHLTDNTSGPTFSGVIDQ